MTKGEEHIAVARGIAAELAAGSADADGTLAERFTTLTAALDEVAGHVFVKGALSVPFTAAVQRAARSAQDAYSADAGAGAGPLEAFEAAVIKLQRKTTGTGGVAIT